MKEEKYGVLKFDVTSIPLSSLVKPLQKIHNIVSSHKDLIKEINDSFETSIKSLNSFETKLKGKRKHIYKMNKEPFMNFDSKLREL